MASRGERRRPSILVHRLALAWTIGVVVLVIGAILAVAGFAGWEIGGRTHWYWAAAAVGCRPVAASPLSSAGFAACGVRLRRRRR